jgi:hypothetical protein
MFFAKNVCFSLFAALVVVVGPSCAVVVEEPSQSLSAESDESTIVASSTTTTSGVRGLRSSTAGRFLPSCGNGNRGDGVCANGQCCSQVRNPLCSHRIHRRLRCVFRFSVLACLIGWSNSESTDPWFRKSEVTTCLVYHIIQIISSNLDLVILTILLVWLVRHDQCSLQWRW